MKKITSLWVSTASIQAFAHDGHGLSGSHWHSSDAWGFVALGVIAMAAWFIGRGK